MLRWVRGCSSDSWPAGQEIPIKGLLSLGSLQCHLGYSQKPLKGTLGSHLEVFWKPTWCWELYSDWLNALYEPYSFSISPVLGKKLCNLITVLLYDLQWISWGLHVKLGSLSTKIPQPNSTHSVGKTRHFLMHFCRIKVLLGDYGHCKGKKRRKQTSHLWF